MSEPTMDDNWWPDLLKHIADEDPWANPEVLVAELRSPDDLWMPGTRWTWTALVPSAAFADLDGELIAFNYEVESTGRPMPGPNIAGTVKPRFWIGAYTGGERLEFDPLILSWTNHNRTAMVLDPGFAATYGLIPRATGDGLIRWDNPAEPEYDVARIDPPSLFDDGRQSEARAFVSRDYLQDYLTLCGVELIQVYYEYRRGLRDEAADALLGDRLQFGIKTKTRELDIRRRDGEGFTAQVWGARRIAGPGALPVTNNPLEEVGLMWPGIDVPVTTNVANRLRPWDCVYVRDTVLAAYEGKPDFRVSSESGHVGYGNQWGVGPCDRIGRDVIQLEIRKLYEGTPHRVVQHWNSFAIQPAPELLTREGRQARNVGIRSRELVFRLADIGLMLCGIAARFGLEMVGTEAYVGLDRAWLEPNGWWSGSHVEPITRHIPIDMRRSDFLSRCLDLDKLLIEPLAQRRLRPLVRAFGKPHDKTEDFRGLKLLNRIVCLCQVALDAGLMPWEAGEEIVARLAAEGTTPAEPLTKLFALSDLRQAAGHRKDDVDAIVAHALARFDIDVSATEGGWGLALDAVYDQLSEQLGAIHHTLREVLRLG